MNIAFVEIQNFRKLKSCRMEIASQETILVGANNSGKTSAMDSMILFLKKSRRKGIATTDFTLSNWSQINQIGTQWVSASADDGTMPDLTLGQWLPYLPSIDIWLDVDDTDIHHVIHLLPTLDWTPKQTLGVRLVFAPRDIETLYKAFIDAFRSARKTEPAALKTESDASSEGESVALFKGKRRLSLWPGSMRDFLDRSLQKQFEVKTYILDPTQCCDPVDGVGKPQLLPADSESMERDPFDGLFKIDVISAQRGFSDPNTEDESRAGFASLSTQLRQYFTKHLDPSESPDASDIKALQAIQEAKAVFDENLKTSFKPAIGELEGLNYPGFSDPRISLSSELRAADTLNHKTAVQFDVLPEGVDTAALLLPEQYNGLGYQNLISMVFSLIRFRDEWIRVGKAAKKQSSDGTIIEPLHIVLIEEPEAHLHAQVQQVFIKKAYAVLRNNETLEDGQLNTQMIVSTHSSHIAHELDFTCLRYFRREPAKQKGDIPIATVVNLSKTFGDPSDTSRFATRYIKSTHCDLFFADAAILVEGSAERMLVPHFIQNRFRKLDQSYITLLEIGGSHAHRLRPLLETLRLPSLVITDLDSIGESGTTKIFPERDKKYRTGNTTLKEWIPGEKEPATPRLLDELLDSSDDEKLSENKLIRVAFQCPVKLKYEDGSDYEETIPDTFEDALALSNVELFRDLHDPKGLLKQLKEALGKDTLSEATKKMFDCVTAKHSNKAEMALELLYLVEPTQLMPPTYISEGLEWLEVKLAERKQDFLVSATTEAKND